MSLTRPEKHSDSQSGGSPSLELVLIDAALELLEADPDGELSLRAIARKAGVSHNAPYHYFADKHALLARLHAISFQHLADAMWDALQGASNYFEAGATQAEKAKSTAIAVGGAYLDFAWQHPNKFALIFDPRICSPADPLPETLVVLEQISDILGQLGQLLLPDASAAQQAQIAQGLWSTVHGGSILARTGHVSRESVRESLVTLLGLL